MKVFGAKKQAKTHQLRRSTKFPECAGVVFFKIIKCHPHN